MFERVLKRGVVVVLAVMLVGCAASRAAKQGQRSALAGDWEAAATFFTKAVQASPGRADYKVYLERAKIEAARLRLERARQLEASGDLELAIVEYRRVLEYNPASREALSRATELERTVRDRLEASRPKPPIAQMREQARRQAQAPLLNPASREPLSLRFTQASTKDILDFIANATGINVTYERDFRPQPFTIQLEGVPLEDALNQIMSGNQLWYKVINDRTILVIPDTTQKRQQYEDQIIRTFFISHADPQELTQLLTQITRVPGIAVPPTIVVNKTANTVTVRSTRGMAEIIERLIEANDRPRAEIIIDIEILEVSQSRAKQYGLNLGDYQVGTIFSPEAAPSGDSSALFNLNTISHGISTADFYMTVPQAVVKFLATDSQTRQIAKPQLRGMEGTKLTLNLGDDIPVPSTVFTPIATGGAATNPLTSFTYRSVGTILEMTPRVSYDGDIILDISVESSNLGDNVSVAGQSVPSFGSRKAVSRLRLREGEANLLAGLISERERKTLTGIPGVMNLPFFKQLLSNNDNSRTGTDIVMLITPRVVRTHELRQVDLEAINIGTQQNIGITTSPQLFIGQPMPEEPLPEAAAPAEAPPLVPNLPPGVRAPDGTTTNPTTPPPGTSPIPGTTTEPPTRDTSAQPPVPSETMTPLPPAQIVMTAAEPELQVGAGPYTVPVSINDASRVSVVSLSITFNPALLRVRAVQEGSFLRQGGVAVAFTQQVDPAAGRIDISMTRTGDTTGASGAGLLGAILFEPVAPGTATLNISGIATTPQGTPLQVSFTPLTLTVR